MRRGAHTRLKALFTISASRDVVERVKSHAHSVAIDLGRGTFVASSHLSPLFFLNKQPFCFFPIVFFLITLLQLFFNFFMSEINFSLFFFFLVLSSCFLSFFSFSSWGLLLACFWAWLKVWVDGWLFLARFGSNSVFPVIDCLVWHRQPAGHRWWRLVIISFCSLSPLFCSLDAVKLNLQDSTVCVEDQSEIVEK